MRGRAMAAPPPEQTQDPTMTRLSLALRLAPLALAAALAGCVTANPDVIPAHEAQRLSTVQEATVIAVRPVTLEGSQSGGGSAIGAVAGSVAGSQIGGYRDGFVGSIIGFVAGAVVGNAIERNATRESGVELTLQLRNGDKRMIVQGQGRETFQPGDTVVVVSNGYRARVSHAPAGSGGGALPAPAPASTLPAPVYSPAGTASAASGGGAQRAAPVYTPR